MIYRIIFLCVFVCAYEFEGDSCTHEGQSGKCVDLGECPAALHSIQSKKSPPKICGFKNKVPIVCCTDKGGIPSRVGQPVQTTSSRPPVLTTTKKTPAASPLATGTDADYQPPESEYVYLDDETAECQPIPAATANKTGRKAFDKCIEYQERLVYPCTKNSFTGSLSRSNNCHHKADELIFGGEDAAKDEFPHMVLLRYGDNEEDQLSYCGGALISDRFVLTAGHCTVTKKMIAVSHVIIGILARSEESAANRHKVKRIITHPEYLPPMQYHDIALLEINRIRLTQFIVPACLHIGDPVNDEKVLASGWGITDRRGSLADVLQKVILQKFTTEECWAAFLNHRYVQRGIDPQIQVCYGDRNIAKDTCRGDSGGPIQIKSKKLHCMYTIVGVTSIGKECGYAGQPAIYTSLANHVPWIESVVWP